MNAWELEDYLKPPECAFEGLRGSLQTLSPSQGRVEEIEVRWGCPTKWWRWSLLRAGSRIIVQASVCSGGRIQEETCVSFFGLPWPNHSRGGFNNRNVIISQF